MSNEQKEATWGEFIIHLSTGARFWTGGFESVSALHNTLTFLHDTDRPVKRTIDGTFDGENDAPWKATYINPRYVVSITDERR